MINQQVSLPQQTEVPLPQQVPSSQQIMMTPLLSASTILGQAWGIYKKRIGVLLGIMGMQAV